MAAKIKQADATEVKAVLTRFATDLLTVYQTVGDLKLDGVMGLDADRARPTFAEGRRSDRSTRAITLNLESASELTRLMIDQDTVGAPILKAIDRGLDITRGLPPTFGLLTTDEAGRAKITLLRHAVREARDLSLARIPTALDITLGFNSLDGD